MINKQIKYLEKRLLTLALCIIVLCLIPSSIFADLTLVNDDIENSGYIPLNQEVAIYGFHIYDPDQTNTITSIQGEFSGTIDGEISEVNLYLDDGDGQFETDEDTEVLNTSNDSVAISDPSGTFNFSDLSLSIVTDNSSTSEYYFVSITLDNNTDSLGEDLTFTLSTITADSGDDLEASHLLLPNNYTCSGLSITVYGGSATDSITPDFVYPGQEISDDPTTDTNTGAPMFLITMEAKGEDIDNVTLTIDDNEDLFSSDNEEDGVVAVSLWQRTNDSLITFNYESGSNLLETIDTDSDSSIWNTPSDITLGTTITDGIDLTEDTAVGFWVVYDIGDDIVVTSDTDININLESLSGTGSSSSLTLEMTNTENVSFDVPVAGISISDLIDETPDDTYGKNSYSQILSFKLQSHQTGATINQINVINNGTVEFATGTESTMVQKVEIYRDIDEDETFSIEDDQLEGSLSMGDDGDDNNTTSKAPISVEFDVSTYTDDDDSYPENNEEMLFIVYYFGSDIETDSASGNFVTAEIGNLTATGSYTFYETLTKSVDFKSSDASDSDPVSSTDTATLTLTDTNVAITSINAIVPATAYEGETKIPMLYVELKADSDFDSNSIVIYNEQGNFTGNNAGVTRVWAYLDTDNDYTVSDNDIYLSSTSTFTDSYYATIPDVKISEVVSSNSDTLYNKILICYSIGQNATTSGDNDFRAQLYSIDADDNTLVLAGTLPTPTNAASLTVSEKAIDDISLSYDNFTSSTSTFNVTLSVTNDDTEDIDITALKPKVYLNSNSGLDISYEFTISDDATGTNIAQDDSLENEFSLIHSTQYSEGTAIIDGYVEYTLDDSNPIIFQRYYNGANWNTAADSTFEFEINQDIISDDILPPYINDPIQKSHSGSVEDFQNGSGAEDGDTLIITLTDPESIDESSITIVLGTTTLIRDTSLSGNSNDYTFDQDSGEIEITVGDTSETITIDVDDQYGNALPTAYISFLISEDVELTNPLFYPNPYVMSDEDLTLGFSLTQPATVKLYVYNFLGNQVYTAEEYKSSAGYNSITINYYEDFIVPGIFICRIVTEDDDGNKSSKTAKLAIY